MSYPLLCKGGNYPVPQSDGMVRMEAIAIHAVDVSLPSTLELTDNKIDASDPSKPSIFKWSRESGESPNDFIVFPDIIKTRNGLYAYVKTNCDVYIYVS